MTLRPQFVQKFKFSSMDVGTDTELIEFTEYNKFLHSQLKNKDFHLNTYIYFNNNFIIRSLGNKTHLAALESIEKKIKTLIDDLGSPSLYKETLNVTHEIIEHLKATKFLTFNEEKRNYNVNLKKKPQVEKLKEISILLENIDFSMATFEEQSFLLSAIFILNHIFPIPEHIISLATSTISFIDTNSLSESDKQIVFENLLFHYFNNVRDFKEKFNFFLDNCENLCYQNNVIYAGRLLSITSAVLSESIRVYNISNDADKFLIKSLNYEIFVDNYIGLLFKHTELHEEKDILITSIEYVPEIDDINLSLIGSVKNRVTKANYYKRFIDIFVLLNHFLQSEIVNKESLFNTKMKEVTDAFITSVFTNIDFIPSTVNVEHLNFSLINIYWLLNKSMPMVVKQKLIKTSKFVSPKAKTILMREFLRDIQNTDPK